MSEFRHAGRYNAKKHAEGYAAVLKEHGDEVEVRPATVWDVFSRPRNHRADTGESPDDERTSKSGDSDNPGQE